MGAEVSPAIEAVLTTWPSPCSTRRGTKARTPWMTPQRLTPITQAQSRSVSVHMGPPAATPALLHTTWAVPNSSKVRAARASTDSPFETSVRTGSTVAPVSARRLDASLRGASSMSAITTRMPSAQKRSASPNPIPLAAPVTTATLPLSSCIIRPLEDSDLCRGLDGVVGRGRAGRLPPREGGLHGRPQPLELLLLASLLVLVELGHDLLGEQLERLADVLVLVVAGLAHEDHLVDAGRGVAPEQVADLLGRAHGAPQ